ncbi:MAG: glycosyltransferase family 4 protein [Bacteroidia bacterium]|jgi:glycosyltransferase involved in cell wall biosynthesis|nr:glycosyltransferase family 4 protein [Bacteroidia bacterium]
MNAQPLRIGLDAKRAFTNGTGLGNYARFVINGLLANYPQHHYYLITPRISEAYANFYQNISNAHVTIVTPTHFFEKMFPGIWRSFYLPSLLNKLDLDIYHGLSNELPFGINQFKGLKVVTIHDLIFKRYPQYYNPIDRFIYQQKFAYAAKHANMVLATSKQTSEDLATYLGQTKSVVTYQNCLPVFSEKPLAAAIEKTVQIYQLPPTFMLSVGTFEPRKRQLELVQTFNQMNHSHLHLVLVGKRTTYLHAIETYITQHRLSHKVHVLTNVQTNDLPALYHAASVFVYVSEFEGFGIPLIEAMRCGVPIIAAPTSSLVEVGGDVVWYANPTNTGIFEQKVNQALLAPKPDYSKQLQLFETPTLMQQLMHCYTQ